MERSRATASHELAHSRRFLARDLVDGPDGRRGLLECLDYFGLVLLAALAEASGESVAGGRELGQRQRIEARDLRIAVRYAEARARSGITGGGGNCCPDAPLTRGQMAIFLSLGLGLHFTP